MYIANGISITWVVMDLLQVTLDLTYIPQENYTDPFNSSIPFNNRSRNVVSST